MHPLLRAGLAALTLVLSAPLSAQGSWQLLDTNTTTDLNAVHFVSADVGYAVGDAGTVLKTLDGGLFWTDVSPGGPDLFGVHFFDASTGVVVGDGGAIGRTTDGGATWSRVPSGTSDPLYSVAFAA
ncbi:MAG: YCF48-related protein, partial [Rubricoccaceae bacterium]|nr:YCF48-related protein [Rubricoccaceae bacterium]